MEKELSLITYTKGEIVLFQANPLASLLGYRNTRQAIRRNVPRKDQVIIDGVRYITIAGATMLIAKATKPEAQAIRNQFMEKFAASVNTPTKNSRYQDTDQYAG